MAEPTIQLGGGNWAGKTDNLLGYYKEGERFYKQDFTFSRSTTGTYTDSDGYIQEMPYNLLQQSNQFDTTWTLSAGIDLTSGQSGYDGTNNAWLLKRNTTGARYVQQSLTRPSGQYSFSVYLKAESTDWSYIWAYDGSTTVNAYFDLNNGVVGNTSGLDSTNVVSVGNDWYRCTITFTQAITSVRIYPAYANGSISTGTDNGIYIQDAQINKGTSAKTYFPTTTRLNIPRVDYLNNSNGSLILEPQRSNIATYSSDLDNAAWTKSGTTITANNTTSPDGTTNADKIIASSGLSIKIAYQVISSTNGVAHTVSAFYKADEYSYAFLRVGGQTPSPYVIYNLSNQSVVSTANATSTKIEDYGSGWYRVSMTYTANSATNAPNVSFLPTSGYTLDSSNQPSYNGDGSSGGYVFGAQLEVGNYPTTIINTSGSSVTRNADACELTNASDSIGQTEGVIFVDFELQTTGEDFVIMNIYNTSSPSNGIYFYLDYSRFLKAYCDNSGNQVTIASGVLSEGRFKAAFAYKENDFAFYLNGSLIGVDTSGTVPTCGGLRLENYQNSPTYQEKTKVYQAQIYNTRLSNSELATLTTL
jgi:hypothetical protein